MNQQPDKEIRMAGYGERAWGFPVFSRSATLPAFPRVHPPGSSPNLALLVFMEASLHSHDWLSHWLIQTPTPFPSLEVMEGTESSNPLIT